MISKKCFAFAGTRISSCTLPIPGQLIPLVSPGCLQILSSCGGSPAPISKNTIQFVRLSWESKKPNILTLFLIFLRIFFRDFSSAFVRGNLAGIGYPSDMRVFFSSSVRIKTPHPSVCKRRRNRFFIKERRQQGNRW